MNEITNNRYHYYLFRKPNTLAASGAPERMASSAAIVDRVTCHGWPASDRRPALGTGLNPQRPAGR